MRRRDLLLIACGATSLQLRAIAQSADRLRRIGVLMALAESDPSVQVKLAAFRQSLRNLGWGEGRNLRIEYRWGAGAASRIRAFAKELVDLSPDIILAYGTPSVVALLQETGSIPVVFLSVTDPLGQGLVSSLAHPGRNITGFSVFEISLGTKWLDLLKEIAPAVRRATIIFNPETAPYYHLYLRSIENAAPSFAIEPVEVDVHDDSEIERAITASGQEPTGGLIVLPDTFNYVNRKLIISLATRYRLPAIYYFGLFARDGGLIAYGPDEIDHFRRAAGYVDRILKGAEPGNLPVQQPTKFELIVNLNTAKAIGLTIPPAVLDLADEIIE